MKEEKVLKGYDILKQISNAQKAKAIISDTQSIELRHRNRGSLGSLYLVDDGNIYLSDVNMPKELGEQIKSELIRFISRAKRHIDNYEFQLKQQLEDLE